MYKRRISKKVMGNGLYLCSFYEFGRQLFHLLGNLRRQGRRVAQFLYHHVSLSEQISRRIFDKKAVHFIYEVKVQAPLHLRKFPQLRKKRSYSLGSHMFRYGNVQAYVPLCYSFYLAVSQRASVDPHVSKYPFPSFYICKISLHICRKRHPVFYHN